MHAHSQGLKDCKTNKKGNYRCYKTGYRNPNNVTCSSFRLLVVYDDGQLLLNSDPKFQTEDHTLIGTAIRFIHIVDGHGVDVRVVGADISGQRPPRFTPVLWYDHPVDLDNGIHVNRALEVDVVANR